ncbi:hypothetical protein FA95DRAFT_1552180 [Auriscalpium vulgare]|uniref:Uncharacterized protein n=1 Tax=Auriscalpium vulgare TaxID=40419 RepID=A0ACB8SBV1_9AGAM|nr:hypothetical protein FA95DRAFT_1552180 [Auriscalpium vulgare]
MPPPDFQPPAALIKREGIPELKSSPPSLEQLAAENIKVRDFAYESMLPPLPSIPRFRLAMPFVQQGQKGGLGPRPLKRLKSRHDYDPDEDPFVLTTSNGEDLSSKSKPLSRKSTEPILAPEEYSQPQEPDGVFARRPGFSDLAYYSPPPRPSATPRPLLSPQRAMPLATTFLMESQEESQGPDTPLVTPAGSLLWPAPVLDTSAIPASQLDSESQVPVQEDDVSYSQLGFSQPFSDSQAFSQGPSSPDHQGAGSSTPNRTFRSPCPSPDGKRLAFGAQAVATPASPLSSPGLSPAHDGIPSPSTSPRPHLTTPPPPYTSPNGNGASPSRYFLRKRASPSSPASRNGTTMSPRRRKSAKPPMMLAAVTRQSAHAVNPKSLRDSPRARPLRKSAL